MSAAHNTVLEQVGAQQKRTALEIFLLVPFSAFIHKYVQGHMIASVALCVRGPSNYTSRDADHGEARSTRSPLVGHYGTKDRPQFNSHRCMGAIYVAIHVVNAATWICGKLDRYRNGK